MYAYIYAHPVLGLTRAIHMAQCSQSMVSSGETNVANASIPASRYRAASCGRIASKVCCPEQSTVAKSRRQAARSSAFSLGVRVSIPA